MPPAAIFPVRAPLTPGPFTTKTCSFLPLLRTMKVVGPDPGVVGETRRLVSEKVTVTFETVVWRAEPEAASATPVTPSASRDAASKACTCDINLRGSTLHLRSESGPIERYTKDGVIAIFETNCYRRDAAAGRAPVSRPLLLPSGRFVSHDCAVGRPRRGQTRLGGWYGEKVEDQGERSRAHRDREP